MPSSSTILFPAKGLGVDVMRLITGANICDHKVATLC